MVFIKLVSCVLGVEEDDYNKFSITVVVNPVSCSGGNGGNITLVQVLNFLMTILDPLSSSFAGIGKLLFGGRFVGFWASRQHNSLNSPTCKLRSTK